MPYSIKNHHQNYLEIVVKGLFDKKSALAAMNELLNHPEYYDKNSLWNFSSAQVGLSLMDLKEIAGVMKLFIPKQKQFADKVALFVSGRVHLGIANIFVTLSTLLPFKYKAFSDIKKAKAYLED